MTASVPDGDVPGAIADLFRRRPPPLVVAAWVFGSHAEGRAHRESDVDVGVLLRSGISARERFDERVRLSGWLSAELARPAVDVVTLEDVPPGLAARVVTRGRRVHVADREREHAFRRDAQLRAADLAPWLARLRRVKLAALRR